MARPQSRRGRPARANSRPLALHLTNMYAAFMDYGEVLVIGGTGFLGRFVARALVARGFLPRLLVRPGAEERIPAEIRAACRVTPGDVTDPDAVENAVQGTGAVVNLAGIVREDPRNGITFQRVHVKGTRNAVTAARRWGIGRFVQVSALGARAGEPEAILDSKGRGEEIVRNSGLRWTVFRPSAVFGPGDRFIDTLAGMARRSRIVPVPGDGRVRFRPVFAGDVAHAIADALSRPRTEGRSIDVGGPATLSLDEIVDAVARALGRRCAKVRVPLTLLRPLARALARFPKIPLSPAEIGFLAADNICDSATFWSEIGRVPLPLDDYLEWMAAAHAGGGVASPGADAGGAAGRRLPRAPEGVRPPSRKAA